jgi:hypothetical protein
MNRTSVLTPGEATNAERPTVYLQMVEKLIRVARCRPAIRVVAAHDGQSAGSIVARAGYPFTARAAIAQRVPLGLPSLALTS